MGWVLYWIGFSTGALAAAVWLALCLFFNRPYRRLIRRILDVRDSIEFQLSEDPPDQGIDQRIYKPRGSAARINRNAMRRPSRKLRE